MKNRFIALICILALCLSTVRAINAGDIYFTSVNDKLIPLSTDTMPTWVSGRLYVPASTFDSSATGIDLGFYFRQNNNTVTLYTLRQMLVFDLNRGIAYDQHTGETLSTRAVNRNGRIYLRWRPCAISPIWKPPTTTPRTAIWSASKPPQPG